MALGVTLKKLKNKIYFEYLKEIQSKKYKYLHGGIYGEKKREKTPWWKLKEFGGKL